MNIKPITGEPDLLDPMKVDRNFCLTVNGYEARDLVRIIYRGISALSFSQLPSIETGEISKIACELQTRLSTGWTSK